MIVLYFVSYFIFVFCFLCCLLLFFTLIILVISSCQKFEDKGSQKNISVLSWKAHARPNSIKIKLVDEEYVALIDTRSDICTFPEKVFLKMRI